MQQEPQDEHRWLEQLVGDWTFESECVMGPDQPPVKSSGTEAVRSIGGLWVVCEGNGQVPEGAWHAIMTLGFDGRARQFVGTFIVSMMSHLWLYEGALDASRRVLTLNSQGPNISGEGDSLYQDIITVISKDERTLTSRLPGPDGGWTTFMQARYRRKSP